MTIRLFESEEDITKQPSSRTVEQSKNQIVKKSNYKTT